MKARDRRSHLTPVATAVALVTAVAAGALTAILAPAPEAHAQRKTISLDEIVIEGQIQKPQAFFILPRTSLNFEDLERREDLRNRIIESVEQAPF